MDAVTEDVRVLSLDPGLVEELIQIKSHGRKSDSGSSSQDTNREWIEREADYVDEVILKVGKRKGASRTLINSVRKDLLLYLTNPGFRHHVSTLTPEDLVDVVWKYFEGVHIPPEVIAKYVKNSDTSRRLRDRGTELYKQRNFHDALHYYNLALMFAEDETEPAGIAYANRSAVLVELDRFEEALQDIKLALKNKYPESRIPKLEQRRKKCQELIQKKREDYLAIDATVRKEMEAEIQDMKNMKNEILQLKQPSPLIPAATDCVEIKFDKNQGRHLVVTRDVAPGTVLIVEDPYVVTLYGLSKWDTFHCHHCLKRIRRGVPCENCVFAIYCDENCKMEASTNHRYECKCLPSFHAMFAIDEVLRAVRIILKAGQEEIFRLFETRDPSYFHPLQPFGTEPNCVYDSQSYLSVFHLATHSEKLDCAKKAGNASRALIATTILETKTDFFEGIPANCRLEFKKFIAALMLRHIEAEPVNAAGIIELCGVENVSFADSFSGKIPPEKLCEQINSLEFHSFAGAIYPLFSLTNHSCDPNVFYFNDVVKGKMVVMAQRALKKCEPLFVGYISGFKFMGIDRRQTELEERYHFKCHCIACKQDWPTLYELWDRPRPPIFCCPTCSKSFFEYEKGSEEFKKCALLPPRWNCGRCGQRYEKAVLELSLDICMGLKTHMYRFWKLNRPLKAFDVYLKAFDFFQYYVCPPNGETIDIQEIFSVILPSIFYYGQ